MRWNTLSGAPPRIIAHRGASGVRPEHTLAAYALAIEQGADAIEPDLVASADGVLFARHDTGLARSTDVASKAPFAGRRRVRGGDADWWIDEFSAAEIASLRAIQPVATRGTGFDGLFAIPRFGAVLDLGLDEGRRRGRDVVVDAEIKHPDLFEARGIDLVVALWAELSSRKLAGPGANVWLECFDHGFLRRAHERCGNPCFALLEAMPDDHAARDALLRDLSAWVRGIAPAKALLRDAGGADSGLVAAAHALGLEVHAWTFRDDRPGAAFGDIRAELRAAFDIGVDALFCDFPDTALRQRAAFAAGIPD